MRNIFLRHLAQTSPEPLALEIAHAEGVWLTNPEGKRYMDLISGIGVSGLGHGHPAVVKAVQEQASRYMHTMVYGEYIMAPQVQLAQWLAQHLPAGLDNVYFTNSGTEATEGALKLAKRFTGRTEIVAMHRSYHGSTHGALSLNSDDYFTRAFRPLLPDVKHITFNCDWCLTQITERTACVISEVVRAEAGIETPHKDYLKKLRTRCDEVGALLILDECQTGCGRTGTLWGFEQFGVVPDIMLLAKGFGGGMPLGAFISRAEIMRTLTHDPVLGHITTFGGHPVSCAASLAAMKVLETDNEIIGQVKHKEQLFRQLLQGHPAILDIRSAGLMMAVEIGDFETHVWPTIQRCLKDGLIVDWFLFNNRSIRIAPPLNISESEIRWACEVLTNSLNQLVNKQ